MIAILLVVAMILGIAPGVMADDRSSTFTLDKNTIHAGDRVKLTITMNKTHSEIMSFEYYIVFDKTLFEPWQRGDYVVGPSVVGGTVDILPSTITGMDVQISTFTPSLVTMNPGELCEVNFTAKSDITGTHEAQFWVIEESVFNAHAVDEADKLETTLTVTVVGSCLHENTTEHAEVAATCTSAGTEAYWECADCGKLYADAECTEAIAAPVAIPMLGHDIVDGHCTRCDYEVPALGLFIDVVPEDTNSNNYGNVIPGQTFDAYLKVKSTEAFVLAGIDTKISYDNTYLTLTGIDTNINIKNETHFFDAMQNIEVPANTEVVLATMHFTVADNAPNGTTMGIAVSGKKEIAKGGEVPKYNASDSDSELGVDITSATLTFLDEDGTELEVITQPVGTSVTAPEVPAKDGYDAIGWDMDNNGEADEVPAVMPAESATFKPVYEAQEHSIALDPDNGEDPIVIEGHTDEGYDEPTDPVKTGYDFEGWDTDGDGEPDELPEVIPAEDLEGKAVWTAKTYTVTFDADGGEASPASKEYTIEDTIVPATVTKAGFTFTGWKVTEADPESNWTVGSEYGSDSIAAGMYGNVILKAQWNIEASFRFEDYAYAKTTQALLVVDAAKLTEGCYMFDEEALFWTDSTDYGTNGAYVTLVDYDTYKDKDAVELGNLLTTGNAATVEIAYDGDVNGDGLTTVTDASIVYQMLTKNGDAVINLDTLGRLEADMVTAKANSTYRGSIADVNAIMNIVPDED